MNWHLGTVGFGYKPWQGVFYPAGMKPTGYLSHYAQYFDSVEIDSTFYGTPVPERVDRWRLAVPETFRFAIKTPQQITHEKRLHQAEKEMSHFVETMSRLGDKLGIILIQLPPDFTLAEKGELTEFLSGLDPAVRYAVEFRHRSWVTPETYTLLSQYKVGQVSADYVILPNQLHTTAGLIYLRFLGRHGRYQTKDKELRDPTSDLKRWVNWINHADLGKVEQIFGYFNNDYAGYSPESCRKFKQLIGFEADLPSFAVQGRLF